MRSRSFILVSGYIIFYLLTNWAIQADNVFIQSLNNILILAICISVLIDHIPIGKDLLVKYFCVFVAIGELLKYIFNLIIYYDAELMIWFYKFNDLVVSVPAYIISFIVAAFFIQEKIHKGWMKQSKAWSMDRKF